MKNKTTKNWVKDTLTNLQRAIGGIFEMNSSMWLEGLLT